MQDVEHRTEFPEHPDCRSQLIGRINFLKFKHLGGLEILSSYSKYVPHTTLQIVKDLANTRDFAVQTQTQRYFSNSLKQKRYSVLQSSLFFRLVIFIFVFWLVPLRQVKVKHLAQCQHLTEAGPTLTIELLLQFSSLFAPRGLGFHNGELGVDHNKCENYLLSRKKRFKQINLNSNEYSGFGLELNASSG